MLRDVENNNDGYVIMQNNGAMKIVNFAHAQTAETRRSFLIPWTPGTRLEGVIFYLNGMRPRMRQ